MALQPGRRNSRRRTRRAGSGQQLWHEVANHADDPDVMKWGLTAEQLLLAAALLFVFALTAVALIWLLPGRVVYLPSVAQLPHLLDEAGTMHRGAVVHTPAHFPFLGPRVVAPALWLGLGWLTATRLARWRPDDQHPVQWLLNKIAYHRAPKRAEWRPGGS